MDDFNDNLMVDDGLEETQQQTQSTQQASQQTNADCDLHLWGYLQPCSTELTRIDFWKISPRCTIGRNIETNQVVLPGGKISNHHCIITWDGSEQNANVVVQDISSNGTFINGRKIGRNQTCVLREGNEIGFGTCVPQADLKLDYRFIYRHVASGPPTTGLYAHYDITAQLGKGSFAVVMKAISRQTGQWVAVKMIQDTRSVRSPGEQARPPRSETFMREIRILEQLKHPNICELKEVFLQENSNDINLVLELVEGGDLLDYILSNNGLSEADAQHITYQLCDAMAYIHSKNITHRDLKPENVLLTKDKPPIVKVADFGLAKFVDSLTMLRTMCGTPSYLAPEVVRQENNEGYDNVVDSWSVGVIVFSMLTNASPFIEDENQRDIRTRVSERTVDWGCLINMAISDVAQDFIQGLLEEDPRQRMTLTQALTHPWLTSYTRVYDFDFDSRAKTNGSSSSIPIEDYSMLSVSNELDGSFRGSVNAGFSRLRIQSSTPAVPGAFPNDEIAGAKPEGPKTARLQRGSLKQLEDAEAGNFLEPPPEMIANAAARERKDVQNTSGGPSSKGQNKRVHAELTPLSEEASLDAVINGSSPLSNAGSPSNKSSSSNSDDDLFKGATAGKGTRGKGKATAAPAKKATRGRGAGKGSENEEDSAVQPRRSTRHPQKVARHG